MAVTPLLLVTARTSGSYCRTKLYSLLRGTRPSSVIPRQALSTTFAMSKEQMEELQKNAFYAKYADKIAKLQKTSPEEFLSRLSVVGDKKNETATQETKDFSLPGQPKPNVATPAQLKQKKLDDVIKLELLSDKTAEEIGLIWTEHYKDKDSVAAVIPKDTYDTMQERFKEFSTFLFPLPRDKGYEFVMVQFSGNEAHFTTLINFQAYKENAPECLSLVHYQELKETKGIVLMAGEYDKNVLTCQEAQCLANQVEMYYCRPSQDKLDVLRKFTYEPTLFHHKLIIEQLETLSLEVPTQAAGTN